MKAITFHLDFISPYAYLAFEQLPAALQGCEVRIAYRPVLFAGLLKHHGQLGPAEIPAKRDWTYRQVQWLAHANGIALDLPATHPFNPLALLRLALATVTEGDPSRETCAAIFAHVWRGGLDAADPQDFLAGAVAFANSRLWGTLSAALSVPSERERRRAKVYSATVLAP